MQFNSLSMIFPKNKKTVIIIGLIVFGLILSLSFGGEREKRIERAELEKRVDALVALGLMGIECYYSRYSAEDEATLLSVAEKRGLLLSGGSDYHGENKTVKLGVLRSDEVEIAAERITLLSALNL